jgi:hypothetical protein
MCKYYILLFQELEYVNILVSLGVLELIANEYQETIACKVNKRKSKIQNYAWSFILLFF